MNGNGKKNLKRKATGNTNVTDVTEVMAQLTPAFAYPLKSTPGANLPEKISEIRDLIRDLDDLWSRIVNSTSIQWGYAPDPETGERKNFNPRNAETKFEKGRVRLNKILQDRVDLNKSNLSMAATKMEPKEGESSGDGNCYIQVVNVGLGDCTTIATPEGVLIMIDMGSDSMTDIKLDWGSSVPSSPEVNAIVLPMMLDTIKRDIFLGTKKHIHFLILTHTDSDHHNKLSELGDDMTFGRVYYSGTSITGYGSSAYITGHAQAVKRVDLMPDETSGAVVKQISGVTPPTRVVSADPGKYDNEYVDSTTGAIVLYQEASGFKLSILASNVTGVYAKNADDELTWIENDADIKTAPGDRFFKLNGSPPNKRSQVILVEFNGKKALITGDATAVTEYFMTSQASYAAIFRDVDVFRLPHHGSKTSSSVRMIQALTGVKEVCGSCSGKFTVAHNLPQQGILNLYASPALDDGHLIWAFDADSDSALKAQNQFKKKTYATGSNGTRIYKFAKP